ncbi:prolyl oligopeptidase [Peniophora sp. CONT]|nr:prolyl oligopeptidase [Peniophora sp. CONT]
MSYTTHWSPGTYPPANRSSKVDEYKSAKQGTVRVPDPYDWLERDTPETQNWVTEQEAYTRSFLDQNSQRGKLEDSIRASTDFERFGHPSLKADNRWYWSYNSGLQAQSVYYRSKDATLPSFSNGETGAGGEVFFDPNVLSEDGTVSLATAAFSRDGKYFAYALSRSGSDFTTIYVRPTSAPLTRADDGGALNDEIRFVKFSGIVWTKDGKGFFYQRYPDRASHGEATSDKAGTETEGDRDAMLYYHRVGTAQSEDVLVMRDAEHPTYMWHASVSEVDGRWLYLYTSKDTSRKNLLWVADLSTQEIGANMKWTKLIDDFDADYGIIGNDGSKLYLQTNADGALRYKIISVDLDKFSAAGEGAKISSLAHDLVPEDPEAKLDDATIVGGSRLVLTYQRNVKDELYVHSLTTGKRLTRLAEDHVGALGVSGRREQPWFFVSLTGFTNPGVVQRYSFSSPPADGKDLWLKETELKEESEKGTLETWRATRVAGLAGTDGFVAEQVWYESKDGTKVPMFIVRHESTPLDGSAPVLQYGYGGFTISLTPFFSPSMLTFLAAYGAILAVPNIRGGGEFGEEWHLAGTRERKVNCFDDFIAASEWLVANKYTSRGRIVLNGGSNGGLLVAACINRAPQGLIGAGIAEVGVLDLLKFADFTIGRAWTSDYGDPHEAADFDFIHPISPLHNVPTVDADGKEIVLPPTMLLTADHDDRVVPLHSFKHAATLQHVKKDNPNPLLIRIEKKAGHGAGKSTEQRIKEAADKWGFVAQVLGLEWKAPKTKGA